MRFMACLCALGALACASSSPPPEGGTRTVAELRGSGLKGEPVILESTSDLGALYVVRAPLDSAFRAMTAAYLSLGLDIKTRDPEAHVVGNKQITVMHSMLSRPLSVFFDCGIDPTVGVPRADRYRVTFSALTTVARNDSSHSRVTTLVSAVASDLATSATPVDCESRGVLERALLHAAGYQTD